MKKTILSMCVMRIVSYGVLFFLSCFAVMANDDDGAGEETSTPSLTPAKKESVDDSLSVMKKQCQDSIKAAKAKNPDSKTSKRIDEASDLLSSASESDVSREAKIASYACCVMKSIGNYRCFVSSVKEQVKNKLSKLFE